MLKPMRMLVTMAMFVCHVVQAQEEYSKDKLQVQIRNFVLFLRNDSAMIGGLKAVDIPEGYKKIAASFDQLGGDLLTRLAFNSDQCFVKASDVDFACEVTNELTSPSDGGKFYITDGIQLLNGKFLMIVSSVSPPRTTIISSDQELMMEILYDSYADQSVCLTEALSYPIRVVYSVSVIGSGGLFMRESGNTPGFDEERDIVISLEGDKCMLASAK